MKDIIDKITASDGRAYFPDCGFLGINHLVVGSGGIREINEKYGTFLVIVYHDDYRKYNLTEYGKWIFGTEKEAEDAIERLPKNGQTVYQIIDNQIVEQQADHYANHYCGNRIDLYIVLLNGEEVYIDEVGQTLFLTYDEATKHLK